MALPRMQGFIGDTQTLITQLLQFADNWNALQQEYAAMTTNGTLPVQADLDTFFGPNVITLAQYNAAIGAQQEVVDYIHIATRAAKLYRVRK